MAGIFVQVDCTPATCSELEGLRRVSDPRGDVTR